MGIGVLGPLTIDGTGGDASGLGPRDRTVLAALVVAGDEALSVDQLADALWGDRRPASWRKVLQGCVARLRRILGPGAVGTVPKGYRVTLGADEIDARRFERLVGRARELVTLGEPDRALFTLEEALALWRGRPLPDVEGWEPGRIEAGRLAELRLDAEDLRVDAALRAGRHLEVLAEAHARVADAPLRERRWELLALAQYQAGRQGEALTTLRRARTVLRDELGLDPGADLIEVERAILRHDPSLAVPGSPTAVASRCPYLGLVPYDVGDAEGFFGRDTDVAASLARLTDLGVLAVVGASGSGKSSLVRAGVAAALRRAGRRVSVITPGPRPADALAGVTSVGGVLIVDQCEEAFTLCEDAIERGRFLDALVDQAERGTFLVVAMRADRFGDVAAHPRFARLVERGLYLLTAMGEADLRTAIEKPAHQAGALLEPGLVDLLVRDVAGEPGALPLLSHALRQTWQRRAGRTLTVAAYREIGGVRGAVATTAEEAYDHLSPQERPLLRELMLRLVVVPSPGGEPSRGRVPRRFAVTGAAQEAMVERLVAARLVTSDEDVVELAHEALARAWPRLRSWLDDDADGLRIRRHLSVAADAWDGMGRPNSETYRGARLVRALDWRDHTRPALTPVEDAFLDIGRDLATAEQRRTARENRRLRALLAAAAVLLVVAGGAGASALRQADRATTAATVADARRIGAQAVTTPQMDRALLLAMHGRQLHDEAGVRAHLLATLARAPQLIGVMRAPDGVTPDRLHVSEDGQRVIALDGTRIGVFDPATRVGAWEAPEPPDPHNYAGIDFRVPGRIAIRPDGERVAVNYGVEQFPWTTGQIDTRTLGYTPEPSIWPQIRPRNGEMIYHPDGQLFVVTYGDTFAKGPPFAIRLWDLALFELPEPGFLDTRLHTDPTGTFVLPWMPDTARFSPDGRLLYVGLSPRTAPRFDEQRWIAYDIAARRVVRQLVLPGPVLDISPDGRLLAIAAPDTVAGPGVVVLLDARNGRELGRLSAGGEGAVQRVRFSHDGRHLAAITPDSTVSVWDPASRRLREVLRGHAGLVVHLAFSPDDATLYTAGQDGTILVWDLRGDRRFAARRATVTGSGATTGFEAAVAPDATSAVLTWSSNGPRGVETWWRRVDLGTGRLGPAVNAHAEGINVPVWRPDGVEFATTGDDGHLRVWDARRGAPLQALSLSDRDVPGIVYTRDGRRIVAVDDRLMRMDAAHVASDEDFVRLQDSDGGAMARSPDGRTVVALNDADGSHAREPIAFIDVVTGRVREHVIGFTGVAAAFSPDGRLLAVVGRGGEVQLVDVATGTTVSRPVVGHNGGATTVAFSGDGGTFVVGGRDGRVTVMDGRTGAMLGAVPLAGPGVATFPAVRPDGHSVVIVRSDGAIDLWDTDPRSWNTFACRVAGRELTAAEWAESIGDRPYRSACG